MWDVACLGELFIDMVPHSMAGGQWLYIPSPGGAPGNVAVGLARLQRKALMIGKVGDEAFGRLIVSALTRDGVDASGVVLSPRHKTGLSVVSLAADGERSFMFYHDEPADLNLGVDEIADAMVQRCKILHVAGLPMSGPISAAAVIKALDLADAAGIPVSCDVNFRPNLWVDPADMIAQGRKLIARASIVKVSDEELALLAGDSAMDDAVRSLWHDRMQLFAVTRGARGAALFSRRGKHDCKGFVVKAIDTLGAGDAFMASLLSGSLAGASGEDLLRNACAAGALAAKRKGAMESLPTVDEIEALLSQQRVPVSFHP